MAPSSPKPASDRSVVAAAFAAIALFVVSWTLLHVGFYKHKQLIDTPVYQRYGNAIADGKVPYRDFKVEYPPGALPVFALPGLAEPGRDQNVSTGFRRSFETLMWLCGAAALAAMAVILRTLRRSAENVWAALCFAAIAPLLLGSVILSRFDLWPAALVTGALAALVSGRLRLGHALTRARRCCEALPGGVPSARHCVRVEARRAARSDHLSRVRAGRRRCCLRSLCDHGPRRGLAQPQRAVEPAAAG